MKAIQIKYLGPTNTKGARLKAWAEGVKPLTEARDYRLNVEEQALEVAYSLCDQLGWSTPCGFGCLPNGDYVATLSLVQPYSLNVNK